MRKILIIHLIILISIFFLQSTVLGADVCVDPAGGGDYTDLQAALDYAETSGANDVIQIVQGIYTGNFNYTSTQGDDITLQGGFTGGCARRVPDPSNTILDGNNTDRVLNIVENGGGEVAVDGITLQNGSSSGWGAGLYVSCHLSSGTLGDISVTHTIAIDNSAAGPVCAGIYVNSQSDSGTAGQVTISNNTVMRNSAESHAGVYARSYSDTGISGDLVFTGNVIANNYASGDVAGAYVSARGGGDSGAITCTGNTLSHNTAANNYGAFRIRTNTDTGTAGDIVFANNMVTDNNADRYAGVYISSTDGITGTAGTVTITNNTIAGNTAATRNGGLYLSMHGSTYNVYNNIIRGNTSPAEADINHTGAGTANGFNNNYTVLAATWDSEGSNIDVDPGFIDPGHGDYRLRSTSGCKDAGLNGAPSLPTSDFEGDNRVIDSAVDIGADEVAVLTTCVSSATALHTALTTAQSNHVGDVIMVEQGTYTRSGNFSSSPTDANPVTLLGGYTSLCAKRRIDPGRTILIGDGAGSVLEIANTGGGDTAIDGFTVQNGATSGSADGGGLSVSSSSPAALPAGDVRIANNIVRNNTAAADGGGVAAYSYNVSGNDAGSVTLFNNIVTGNTAAAYGGGANLKSFTSGGGTAGTVNGINNTISGNHANIGGGVSLTISGTTDGMVNIHNSVIRGNTITTDGEDLNLDKGTGGIAIGFNNNAGDASGSAWDFDLGNIDVDPLFTSNYHLRKGSPCIDTGLNAAATLSASDFEDDSRIHDGDKDGTATVDMGADEFVQKGALSHLLLLLLN